MKFIRSIYINLKFYIFLIGIAIAYIAGYFVSPFIVAAHLFLIVFVLITLVDVISLYTPLNLKISARRHTPKRFSNGDENKIILEIQNTMPRSFLLNIIDELPDQFQERNFSIKTKIQSSEIKNFSYNLRPVKRGEYHFGFINIYVKCKIGFISRRIKEDCKIMVPTYPSFIQMKHYEIMAHSHRLSEIGVKRIRRRGHLKEFEQIREYIKGDDYRTINWKASARKTELMVNEYQDEKSQNIYSIIDMGRTMKSPFNGMTLLDYSINASLILANISLIKDDKAGLICFSQKIDVHLPAQKKKTGLQLIMEALYNLSTTFRESDYERLYAEIRRNIKQRSLLFLYTNFEGFVSLKRQLPYFRKIANHHRLVVVFFDNPEIRNISQNKSESIEDIYTTAIAEKYLYEKRLISRELDKYGIFSVLTDSEMLNINTINKYLEIKGQGRI
ncbi:MAG: DUF58 domain-containing protein [Marinilabiliales bacterium]|nr:MAG: DUF58 domain-containing protein [Marinilabiliales bacterium]